MPIRCLLFCLWLALAAPHSHAGNGTERGGGDDRVGEFTDAARRALKRLKGWESEGVSPVLPEVPADLFERLIDEVVVETLKPVWITIGGKKVPNFQTVVKKGRRIRVPAVNIPSRMKIILTGPEWDERKTDDARERFAFHELVRIRIPREDDYELSTPYWERVAADRDDRAFRRALGLQLRELKAPVLGRFDLGFGRTSLAMSAIRQGTDYRTCTRPGSDTLGNRSDLQACTNVTTQLQAIVRDIGSVPFVAPEETLEARQQAFLAYANALQPAARRDEAIGVHNRLIGAYNSSFQAADAAATAWVQALDPSCPGRLNEAVACAVGLFEALPRSKLAIRVAELKDRTRNELDGLLRELETDVDGLE
jgi:hypothetical protein